MSGELPDSVQRTHDFLTDHGVGYITTENVDGREAQGCKDAANSRDRLGEKGIPLWDELKTLAFRVESADRIGSGIVMVHCRGDRQFNIGAITKELGVGEEEIHRLEAEDLEKLGMGYGLVNPFRDLEGQITHLFDRDLLGKIGIPGTVMTNAGHRAWGVELDARTLFECMPNAREVDISIMDSEEGDRPKWVTDPLHIGAVTGNGAESGILLWQLILSNVRKGLGRYALGDIVMPEFTVRSIPRLGLTMQLDKRHEAVRPYLQRTVRELCEIGANLISVACNTTPYYAEDIRSITDEYGARFLSMPEEAGNWLRTNKINSIEFIAAKPVAKLDQWSAYREPLHGIDVKIPDEDTLKRIDELAYNVKAVGATHTDLNRLGNVIRTFEPGSTVLFALTEMSQLLALRKATHKDRVKVVDSMDIYAQRIAEEYLGKSESRTMVGCK